jgi:hypothetical protein
MAERYFAGTRSLLAARSRNDIIYQTTLGSPARYDPNYTDGCLQFSGMSGNSSSQHFVQVPIMGPRSVITNTELWASMLVMQPNNGGSSSIGGNRIMSFLNSSGVIVAYFANVALNGSETGFFYRSGSSMVSVGPATTLPVNALFRLVVRLIPGANGTMQAWLNNSIIANVVGGLSADFNEIAFVRFHTFSLSASYVSQIALADFDLRAYSFGSDALNANGFYNDGTGNAADTGDTSFATFKGLPAVGNRFTGTSPPRTFSATEAIDAVMISAAIRAVSPAGNAAGLLRIGSTDYEQTVSPAPNAGFEIRQACWDLNPATGLPWDPAAYNAAERGARALAP